MAFVHLQEILRQTVLACNELLRHFWAQFPLSTSKRVSPRTCLGGFQSESVGEHFLWRALWTVQGMESCSVSDSPAGSKGAGSEESPHESV